MRIRIQPHRSRVGIPLFAGLLILLMAVNLGAAAPQFNTANPMHQSPRPVLPESSAQPDLNAPPSPPLGPRHQRDLLKSNYQKVKQEADELADLAKSLQDELTNSTADVLSLKAVQKAEKIEKLAKKIRTASVDNTN
jgi:hypothetical protein